MLDAVRVPASVTLQTSAAFMGMTTVTTIIQLSQVFIHCASVHFRLKKHFMSSVVYSTWHLVHLDLRKHNCGVMTLTRYTWMDLLPELACLQLCPYIDYDKIMLAEVTGASVLVGRVATLALFFSK